MNDFKSSCCKLSFSAFLGAVIVAEVLFWTIVEWLAAVNRFLMEFSHCRIRTEQILFHFTPPHHFFIVVTLMRLLRHLLLGLSNAFWLVEIPLKRLLHPFLWFYGLLWGIFPFDSSFIILLVTITATLHRFKILLCCWLSPYVHGHHVSANRFLKSAHAISIFDFSHISRVSEMFYNLLAIQYS